MTIMLGKFYTFEVKTKFKSEGGLIPWEMREPTIVNFTEDDVISFIEHYIIFLKENDFDFSNVKEFRVNRQGSLQGYYFSSTRWN